MTNENKLIFVGKILGPLLILSGLLISIYIVLYAKINPLTGLGLVGLVTFTFVLFGTYLLTEKWNFGCGEFRKAITISILAVFFATLAFGDQIVLAENTVIGQVFTNFWAIVSTVVAFYFAARVVDTKTLSKDGNEVDEGASSLPDTGSSADSSQTDTK
ncbi:MAG: hypothetical protein WAK14_07295 [Methanobacterium sp.]